MALKVWSADKRFAVNNFLKHFSVSLVIFGLYILGEYLVKHTVSVDNQLILLGILVLGDFIAAMIKALENYNEEWAKKFQWFFTPFFIFLKKLLERLWIGMKKN